MLENDRMETASTEVTSIWRRNDIEKSTWRTHRYFVDFESRIHVEISASNRCHNFHVNSSVKMDVISMKNRWTFHVEFRRRIDGESTKMCPLDVDHFGAAIENTSAPSDCNCYCYGNHKKLARFCMYCEATMKLILLSLHILVVPSNYWNLVSFGIKFNIH